MVKPSLLSYVNWVRVPTVQPTSRGSNKEYATVKCRIGGQAHPKGPKFKLESIIKRMYNRYLFGNNTN